MKAPSSAESASDDGASGRDYAGLCQARPHGTYAYPADARLSPRAFLRPLSPARIRALLDDEKKLCGWVSAFYDGGDAYGGHGEPARYQTLVGEAIAAADIESLEALWQGVYYHGRDSPAYEDDLRTAARRGDLAVFRHVLHAYHHNSTVNVLEPVPAKELLREAANNGPVRAWVAAHFGGLRALQGDGDSGDDSSPDTA
jgi:hypothetical protein